MPLEAKQDLVAVPVAQGAKSKVISGRTSKAKAAKWKEKQSGAPIHTTVALGKTEKNAPVE
jgi:hypothetical protein